MNESISKGLHITFLVHAVVAVIFGALLWIIPGRSLTLIGWIPEIYDVPGTDLSAPGTILVDAIITRLLGAALLAMAISSFQGWRADKWGRVELLVQFEAAFCVLSVVAFMAVLILLGRSLNLTQWGVLIILLGFAVAWIVGYWRQQSESVAVT